MIVIAIFHSVLNDKDYLNAYTNYRLVKSIYEKNELDKIICLNYDKKIGIPEEYFISINSNLIFKIIFKTLSFINRIFPRFNDRYYKEIIFDQILSTYILNKKNIVLLFTKPLFPKTIKTAKKRGIKTYVISSIAHPLFNYSLVRNEEIKYKLNSISSYTNIRRVQRLSTVYAQAYKIFINGRHNIFSQMAYLNYIREDKLIYIKDYPSIGRNIYNVKTKKERNNIIFLHISYMNLIKGIQYLLKAWGSLIDEYQINSKLVLVGKTDRNVKRLLKNNYKNLKNIELKGFANNLKSEYENADIFISPSVSDAGPATILEALAAGLPVISSKNCGFSELIKDKSNGFTYQYNDTKKLANLIYWFIQNKEKIPIMSHNAKKTIDSLSRGNFTSKILETVLKNK